MPGGSVCFVGFVGEVSEDDPCDADEVVAEAMVGVSWYESKARFFQAEQTRQLAASPG